MENEFFQKPNGLEPPPPQPAPSPVGEGFRAATGTLQPVLRRRGVQPPRGGYSYFAFISYRHTDAKWANLLQRKLQSYRLPLKTRKKHPELPQRLNPVFLDKTSLTPGLLDEGLRQEVQASRYLIVICSRSAREKPEYLDQEIQYFLDGGGDPANILPFIVDRSEHPEQECFPPRLQQLCRTDNILGAIIHELGTRRAILKLIAAMHGLRMEEIESEDKRRRRRQKGWIAAAAVLLLAGLGVGTYFYLDYNLEKTEYYLDYVERYGVPEGIGRLSKSELTGLEAHYTLKRQQGKVRELRYEDSYGRLVENSDGPEETIRATRALYDYGEDDALRRISYYDDRGGLLLVKNYTDLSTVELLQSSSSYLNRESPDVGYLLPSAPWESDSMRNTILRQLIEYDENGFVRAIYYVRNPTDNSYGTDSYGVAGLRYARDAQGRMRQIWYLGYQGADGMAGRAEDYTEIGMASGVCSKTYDYDERGDLTEIRFLSTDGTLTTNSHYYAIERRSYDSWHNHTLTACYSIRDRLILNDFGYASRTMSYNDRGIPCETRYYGLQGEPVAHRDGYYAARRLNDENGRTTEIQYLGADDRPTMTREGYAIERWTFNAQGYDDRYTSCDADGNPVVSLTGYAGKSWAYDALGRVTEMSYYDADGQRSKLREGYATVRFTYDEAGNTTSAAYFDEAGSPAATVWGYAMLEISYDRRGKVLQTRVLDGAGNPTLDDTGCCVTKYEYDDYGSLARVSYCLPDGTLTVRQDLEFAGYEQRSDAHGNVTWVRCFGAGGETVMGSTHYAVVERKYDSRGTAIETVFYETDGQTLSAAREASAVTVQTDDCGNAIREDYRKADGSPGMNTEPCAWLIREYDELENLTAIRFYDADGNPVNLSGGYAAVIREYDADGRPLRVCFYDADGTLVYSEGE